MLIAVVVVFCPRPAGADEIKLGGFWIKDVSIQGIEGGQVLYVNRVGTELSRPLGGVQGMRLTNFPQLGQAEEAAERGDRRGEIEKLNHVRSRTNTQWLRNWVGYRLVAGYNDLGMAAEAMDVYLRLAMEQAPVYYLAHPPLESVGRADKGTQEQLRQRIAETMELLDPSQAAAVRQLLEAISPDTPLGGAGLDGGDPSGGQAATTQNPAGNGEPPPTTPSALHLTLAKDLDVGDPVTIMLIHGQFEEALSQANKLMENDGEKLPMRLYQRGIALLNLAQDDNDDPKRYQDAGLSFMSVVAYFPKSSYVAPSIVEAGLVHQRIGRAGIARKLLDQASAILDPEDDPRYAARLQELLDAAD